MCLDEFAWGGVGCIHINYLIYGGNMSNSPLWVEGSIRWGWVDYTPGIQSEDGKAKEGEIIYTPMYGDDAGFGPALNCGNLASNPVYPPAQPIILTSQYGLYNCFSSTPSD